MKTKKISNKDYGDLYELFWDKCDLEGCQILKYLYLELSKNKGTKENLTRRQIFKMIEKQRK